MTTKQRVSASKLKELESKFAATLVVTSLLCKVPYPFVRFQIFYLVNWQNVSQRGVACTISNLSGQVSKMCKGQQLTLTDLQIIQNMVPSVCYIRAIQKEQIQKNSDASDDDLYELKFSFPITPNNIGKLVNKFKEAVAAKQLQSRKRASSQSNHKEYDHRPRKKRKLTSQRNTNVSNNYYPNKSEEDEDDDDLIKLNLKALPPKDLSVNFHIFLIRFMICNQYK